MKTSNKILSTAFAAYLLFTAGNSAAILKEYKRAEATKIRHQKTGRVYNTTGFLIP